MLAQIHLPDSVEEYEVAQVLNVSADGRFDIRCTDGTYMGGCNPLKVLLFEDGQQIQAVATPSEIEVLRAQVFSLQNQLEAIKDAFNFSYAADKPTVYLEGRTDELYFNKALDIYKFKSFPYRFKWVGRIDEKGQEINTGKDSLEKAVQFLISQNLSIKNICLFDCDTTKKEISHGNVFTRTIPTYVNNKIMKRGIENALILDSIDLSPYYQTKYIEGNYGDDKTIKEFDKMACCEGICKLDNDILEIVFRNLKAIIDNILSI